MKVLFYFPDETLVRKASLSYTSLQEGGGFSGTETALLEMSNYLVKKGHSVTIFGVNSSYTDSGVLYISKNDIGLVDTDVDWYSPIFFLTSEGNKLLISKLNPTRTKVFLWFQCFIENKAVREIQSRFSVYGQYLCDYVAREYHQLIPVDKSWIIYNGISTMFTAQTTSSENRSGNWVFHPVYERGGSVTQRIFSKIQQIRPESAKQLTYMSYYTPDKAKISQNNSTVFVGSLTKKEVCTYLQNSDYFVYPLVLESGQVHHDTFGSVMLEALACGTIVVVWDVACISNIYSDYVVKIPVPEHVKKTYDPYARYGQCRWMLSEEACNLFVSKILELENDPTQKEIIRERGREWAHGITWSKNGERMEHELLSHLG